ncbi:MAG: hypothetical protein QXE31_02000 [Candidatus Woesearchaeota archaeon]
MEKPKPKKERIWLYIDKEILDWVYQKMKEKVYADESHCFEKLVMDEINREKQLKDQKELLNQSNKNQNSKNLKKD